MDDGTLPLRKQRPTQDGTVSQETNWCSTRFRNGVYLSLDCPSQHLSHGHLSPCQKPATTAAAGSPQLPLLLVARYQPHNQNNLNNFHNLNLNHNHLPIHNHIPATNNKWLKGAVVIVGLGSHGCLGPNHWTATAVRTTPSLSHGTCR